MTRFYFHVRRGENIATDTEGTECADVGAAREQALISAREILADAIKAAKSETPGLPHHRGSQRPRTDDRRFQRSSA